MGSEFLLGLRVWASGIKRKPLVEFKAVEFWNIT